MQGDDLYLFWNISKTDPYLHENVVMPRVHLRDFKNIFVNCLADFFQLLWNMEQNEDLSKISGNLLNIITGIVLYQSFFSTIVLKLLQLKKSNQNIRKLHLRVKDLFN